jgi:hypothetical protein
MRSGFSFVLLAMAGLAGPAFAQTDELAGRWDGTLVRNGVEKSIALRLSESQDIWRGMLQIDGSATPLDGVRVAQNSVHFELPGQGVFDGTFSGGSMTGSVSGSGTTGTFALTRDEPQRGADPYGDAVESSGP